MQKSKTIKFLEENMEETFCDLCLGKDLLDISQSAQYIKFKKWIKLGLTEIKNLCSLKENGKTAWTGRNIFKPHT